MDNRKLLIHVRREAEGLAQADVLERLQAVIRKARIPRADVENDPGTNQVSRPGNDLAGGEDLRSVGIVSVNSVVHGRAGLVQRMPARIAREHTKLVAGVIVE